MELNQNAQEWWGSNSRLDDFIEFGKPRDCENLSVDELIRLRAKLRDAKTRVERLGAVCPDTVLDRLCALDDEFQSRAQQLVHDAANGSLHVKALHYQLCRLFG